MDFEKVRQRLFEAEGAGEREQLAASDVAEHYGKAWVEFQRAGALPVHRRRLARLAGPGELERFADELGEYQKWDAPFRLKLGAAGEPLLADLASFDLERRVDLFVAALQQAMEDVKALL